MDYSPILVPVVALVTWTLIVMLWMVATRFPAMKRKGVSLKGAVGSRGVNLDGVIDDRAQWVSHNYNHLMEQPTVFYAVALALALMDMGGGLNYWLAWGYVGLRVVHSLVQGTVNIVWYRFIIFFFASLCLIGLTVHAALRIARDCGLI